MGRRWWQKEARRIQNHRAKPRLSTTTEQVDVEEMNDEVAAVAIDELSETLADASADVIVNEAPASEDVLLDTAEEEESFEPADFSEDIVSDDAVEEVVTPAVTGTFNQNNNAFKKKKRR